MADSEKITRIVFKAIDEVNRLLLPREQRLAKSLTQVLSGPGAQLDSLGLTNLIVAIEQQLEKEMNVSVVLADERAMAQAQNPFSTVGTLIDYINQVITP